MSMGRSGFFERRGAAAIVFALFVAGGIIFIFAGTLARATELEQEAAIERAEVAALEELLAASEAEVAFIVDDGLLAQQARAGGLGESDEVRFALPPDAPSPEPIVPLGRTADESAALAPLDAWLALLFGA